MGRIIGEPFVVVKRSAIDDPWVTSELLGEGMSRAKLSAKELVASSLHGFSSVDFAARSLILL